MVTTGFIGYGVVGQATAKGFGKNHKILFHDKHQVSEPLGEVVRRSEFIFICVPTPVSSDGSFIDLSIIEEVVESAVPAAKDTDKILIIRSTVIPGTTARLAKRYPGVHFATNPEFLREKHAEADFLKPDRIVIGAGSREVASRIEALYRTIFPPAVPIFLTDPTSAEVVKYMSNTFLAVKVVFGNEMAALCETLGVGYEGVKEMVAADRRIGSSHLTVTPERGFGGKCLAKDTVALLDLARKLDVDLSLIRQAWEKNLKIRRVRDWEKVDSKVRVKVS